MKERLATNPPAVETASLKRNDKPQPYGVFIAGLGGARDALYEKEGIHNAYAEVYGPGNFTTFPGAISSDRPEADHFNAIADTIVTEAPRRPVHVIMHSLGTTVSCM